MLKEKQKLIEAIIKGYEYSDVNLIRECLERMSMTSLLAFAYDKNISTDGIFK